MLAKTVEYAHGGTVPIAELNDSVGDPIACSIDPGTGNLAIANAQNTILIYKQAEGTPKVYTDANIAGFSYCAYDGLGNLFADGFSQSAARLVELVKGAREFRNIAGFDHSGSLQWDGTYLAAASIVNGQQWTQIDRMKVAGNVAKIVQTVELQNPRFPFDGQFWIQGDTIIGLTAGPRANAQVLEAWPYPAGGAPKHAY